MGFLYFGCFNIGLSFDLFLRLFIFGFNLRLFNLRLFYFSLNLRVLSFRLLYLGISFSFNYWSFGISLRKRRRAKLLGGFINVSFLDFSFYLGIGFDDWSLRVTFWKRRRTEFLGSFFNLFCLNFSLNLLWVFFQVLNWIL